MDILADLTPIFKEVFDDDDIILTRHTTANDIDAWDSLSHMNLVIAIESRFKVRFAFGELASLKNVGHLADLVTTKLAKN